MKGTLSSSKEQRQNICQTVWKWAQSKRYVLNVILACAAVALEVYYSICGGECSYLRGRLFGIDLQYIGIAFMALIIFLSIIKKDLLLLIALSAGIGVEVYLIGFQVWYNTYCTYCLAFGGVIVVLFFLNIRKTLSKIAIFCAVLTLMLFAMFFKGSATPLYAADTLVPSFGTGAVKVRIYTDYFCPPCRAMEPKIEPILAELVKKNIINLTFVDTPIYKSSALYARYFLYILNEKNEFEFALLSRSLLIGASLEKISDASKLEAYLNGKGIRFKAFDIQPTIDIFNGYLKNDKINATPTCVIEQDGRTEKIAGGPEITDALERLKRESVKKAKK
ncbi:MAG: thioredoxin domain-containing protein [Proteobacteria bacterium]|nr:thioredoxin domain-containing protein [Pseudomonadota bacterium]